MKNTLIPHWLQVVLDTSGLEQGPFTFGEGVVVMDDLPQEYVGIADAADGGLAVAKSGDGIIYRWVEGRLEVYAVNEQEFSRAIRRDEAWEELLENMPATATFGLGIILKSRDIENAELTLGYKGSHRDSVMVIQGEMRAGEMLTDALDRELREGLEIEEFEVLDVVDEHNEWEHEQGVLPSFTVKVLVKGFDPSVIGDARIGWIAMNNKTRIVN